MNKPGRKSTAELATVPVLPIQRPQPPDELSPQEAEKWREIVNAQPVDWWTPGNLPLLVAYVRAISAYEFLSGQLERYTSLDTDEQIRAYKNLSQVQKAQADLMATMATKMRLTQQSRYTEKTAATATKKTAANKPWDFTKTA